MKLIDFKNKHKMTWSDIATQVDRPLTTVKFWADDGYTVRTKGKQVIAIFRPMKVMWESEEYAERSKQMGVNQ